MKIPPLSPFTCSRAHKISKSCLKWVTVNTIWGDHSDLKKQRHAVALKNIFIKCIKTIMQEKVHDRMSKMTDSIYSRRCSFGPRCTSRCTSCHEQVFVDILVMWHQSVILLVLVNEQQQMELIIKIQMSHKAAWSPSFHLAPLQNCRAPLWQLFSRFCTKMFFLQPCRRQRLTTWQSGRPSQRCCETFS